MACDCENEGCLFKLEDKLKERDALISGCNEMIFELFQQSCGDWVDNGYLYDHMCISTYENTQGYLIKIGKIKESECRRK